MGGRDVSEAALSFSLDNSGVILMFANASGRLHSYFLKSESPDFFSRILLDTCWWELTQFSWSEVNSSLLTCLFSTMPIIK